MSGNDLDVTCDTGVANIPRVRVFSDPAQPATIDWTVSVSGAGEDDGRVLGYITDTRDKALFSGIPSSHNPFPEDQSPYEVSDIRFSFLRLRFSSVRGAAVSIARQYALNTVTVVFRKWRREQDGDGVIALFPRVKESGSGYGFVQSFEHVGQHGAADYDGVIARTRPATPEEYAELRRELEAEPYGYVLDVRRRCPS